MIYPRITRFALMVWMLGLLMLLYNQSSGKEVAGAALRVFAIEIDGKAAESATAVSITTSAEGTARKVTLRKGKGIVPGTEIVVPARTVLVLETANGEEIRLQPGCGFKTNSVSNKGETHTLLFGKAFFKVKHPLDFFNVNYDSFLAIVRGTEFSVAVEPNKEISFTLDKGKLLVQRDVKVKILEEDKVATLTASEVLEQGGKTAVSYRLDIDEYLKEFKTFKDAEEYYRRKLEEDEQSGDYERIQQGLNGMGTIMAILSKNREAIGYYERALLAARNHHDDTWAARIINNQGNIYLNLGEYRNAILCHEKSLSMFLKLYPDGVHRYIAMSYNNLGIAYRHLSEYHKAI